MPKQRIFISGVAGFLGSHLADAFLADGHEVIGNDNMIGGYLDNVPEGVEFYQFDCNDFDKLKQHMKGVDIAYHCAATAYEGLSVFSPHLITQNIVGASTAIRGFTFSSNASRQPRIASSRRNVPAGWIRSATSATSSAASGCAGAISEPACRSRTSR